jgi:hypothetical protein
MLVLKALLVVWLTAPLSPPHPSVPQIHLFAEGGCESIAGGVVDGSSFPTTSICSADPLGAEWWLTTTMHCWWW